MVFGVFVFLFFGNFYARTPSFPRGNSGIARDFLIHVFGVWSMKSENPETIFRKTFPENVF